MSSPDYRFQWSPTASVVAGGDDSPSSEKLKDNPLLSVPFNKDSVYTSGNQCVIALAGEAGLYRRGMRFSLKKRPVCISMQGLARRPYT